MDGKSIVEQYNRLKSGRGTWEQRWQESAQYCAPIYAHFTEQLTSGELRGKRQKLNDATAIKCVNILGKTMQSMITPPGMKWIDFEEDDLPKPSGHAKGWMQDASSFIQREFNISNFDKEMSAVLKMITFLGLPGLFFDFKYDNRFRRKMFHFTALSPRDFLIFETPKKKLNRIIRRLTMSASRIVEEWPESSGEKMRDTAQKEPFREFEILHYVYEKKNEKSRFNYISKYVLLSEKKILNRGDSGYYTFPYFAIPWECIPGDIYSNCPAFDAMGHIKTLNEAVAIQMENYEKAINPPTLVGVGALVQPELDLSSRAFNQCNDINGIKNLIDQGRWDVAEFVITSLRQQVEQMFYIDQIQLPPMEGTPHTAYEIQKRVEFQQRILGPMFGTHNFDFLDPLIERAVDLLWREGMLGDIPAEIIEGGFKPRYVGPLSKAQRLGEAAAVEEFLANYFSILSNAPMAVEAKPELLTMLDYGEIFKLLADAKSVPLLIFNQKSKEDAAQLQNLQMAKMQADMASQGAAAYKDFQTGQKMANGG